MITLRSSKILLRTGNLLIYIGLILTVIQFGVIVYLLTTGRLSEQQTAAALPARSVEVSAPVGGKLGVNTTYPGLILAAFGTILLVAAHIGSSLSKHTESTEGEK
jgi:hypothetical protein